MNPIRSRRVKATLTACLVLSGLLFNSPDAFAQNAAKSQRVPQNFTIIPIDVTSVAFENGQLVARGLVGSNAFTSVLTLATRPGTAVSANGTACPILDLSLAP